jgi:hypothetical protein
MNEWMNKVIDEITINFSKVIDAMTINSKIVLMVSF